jgi:5'-nucleotidase
LEGRFLQVGGMSFAFDPTKPPHQRVDPRLVRIGDHYLEFHTKYRLVTKSFMHAGSHGFHVLNKTKILVTKTRFHSGIQNTYIQYIKKHEG